MPCVTSTGSPCRDLTRSVHPRQRLELPCLPLLPGASGLLPFRARSPRRIQPYTAYRVKAVGSCRKIRLYSPSRCVVNPGTGGGIPTQPAQTSFIRTAGQERGHPPSAFQLESTRERNRLLLRDKLTPVCFFFLMFLVKPKRLGVQTLARGACCARRRNRNGFSREQKTSEPSRRERNEKMPWDYFFRRAKAALETRLSLC